MRKYTREEIKKLNSNPYVKMVKYGSQIEYRNEFKKWAVKTSVEHPELSAMQIFEIAGFDRGLIKSASAKSRIRYWKSSMSMHNNELAKTEKENRELIIGLISRFDKLITVINHD